MSTAALSIKALVSDVFGTVFDWRSSIIVEGERLGRQKGLNIDWERFSDRWRAGYLPALDRVRKGELPWTKVDGLHRMILDSLLVEFGIYDLTETEKVEFNRVWHRLKPWPDAQRGLTRLRRGFILGTLSNGHVALLANLSKNAGLSWDVILSAEFVKHYKPDPEVYRMAPDMLDLRPDEVMLAASHPGDLLAARAVGLRTALILRPLEYGPNFRPEIPANASFDRTADDLEDLAAQFGW